MKEETILEFRNKAVARLKVIFKEDVRKEWDIGKNSTDDLTRNIYCPRIDVAVGPWNIHRRYEDRGKINQAYYQHAKILGLLNNNSIKKFDESSLNENPRCFLTIEVENTGTRKSRLGSIINASAIGKIGIVVAWNDEVLHEIGKIDDYLIFLREVGKIPQAFKNVMIIRKDHFCHVLNF